MLRSLFVWILLCSFLQSCSEEETSNAAQPHQVPQVLRFVAFRDFLDQENKGWQTYIGHSFTVDSLGKVFLARYRGCEEFTADTLQYFEGQMPSELLNSIKKELCNGGSLERVYTEPVNNIAYDGYTSAIEGSCGDRLFFLEFSPQTVRNGLLQLHYRIDSFCHSSALRLAKRPPFSDYWADMKRVASRAPKGPMPHMEPPVKER